MKTDNTPTVTRRTRPISRKLRLRLETARMLKKANQRTKTVRQKKKESKANAKERDPDKHVELARVPRLKKNKLAAAPTATTKYKKRQVHKTWLPTHLWHTKRARMTRPTLPLWRMSIPLTPTQKTYRQTHRAGGSRGCVAWDASYMSTVGCRGTSHTLENMLILLGFVCDGNATRQKKWKAGTRHAQGWIYEIEGQKQSISPATVVWMVESAIEKVDQNGGHEAMDMDDFNAQRPPKTKPDRRLLIRVHPAAFQQFWSELLKAAKMQKPQVLIEDLRYEIGSIEVTGPGSTEALLGVLKPRHPFRRDSVEHVWTFLTGLNSPAALPDGALLAFGALDPRLIDVRKQKDALTRSNFEELNKLIVSWPTDQLQTTPELLSHKARWVSSTNLPTQKAINRRKSGIGKGKPLSVLDKDPAIPIILLASRHSGSKSNLYGHWTILLPWCCVDVVWRALMRYPLTSGGTPTFGGLEQTQQLALERTLPWYPADFPGSEAGQAWERTQVEKRFDTWLRRPPSRRLAWDLVELGLGRRGELGRGWSCDWDYLLTDSQDAKVPASQSRLPDAAQMRQHKLQKKQRKRTAKAQPKLDRRRNTSSPESDAGPELAAADVETPVINSQLTPVQASKIFSKPMTAELPSIPTLATIRIRLLSKGTPKPAARIYRLPLSNLAINGVLAATSNASSTTQPSADDQASNSVDPIESAPPPGQQSLPTPSTNTATSSTTPFRNLREKWLSLVPPSLKSSNDASNFPKHKKQKQNHHSLPPQHVVRPNDPPDHINVLPKNAPQSIIDEFGREPLTAEQIKEDQRQALMRELMKNEMKPGEEWDASKGLVECPDAHDLIGFVTSGAFNLTEGRGTAIGGIWVQRLIEGWRDEDLASGVAKASGSASAEPMKRSLTNKTKTQAPPQATQRSEQYLCIIRNSGESVGRLGIWELC